MRRQPLSSRPAIWAEGSQSPRFNHRSFLQASVIFARDGLFGLLQRAASAVRGFGLQVASGRWRIPAHRLGRSGRFLPSVAQMAGAMAFFAAVLQQAALRVMRPEVVAAEAGTDARLAEVLSPRPARLGLVGAQPADAAAVASVTDDDDLRRIRALMQPPDDCPEALIDERAAAETLPVPAKGRGRQLATVALALPLAGVLFLLSLPYGLCRATIAHLAGTDLREIE